MVSTIQDWDYVMDAARRDWHPVRRAAEDAIVRRMGEDSGCGISSSDINHTIYGAGKFLLSYHVQLTPEALIQELSEIG